MFPVFRRFFFGSRLATGSRLPLPLLALAARWQWQCHWQWPASGYLGKGERGQKERDERKGGSDQRRRRVLRRRWLSCSTVT